MAEVGYDTLLEGDLPEEVANYSSLATFAGKTQTDWEDEIWGAEDARWGGILAGLFTGLQNVGSFVLSLLQTIANNIFAGVQFVFDTVADGLTQLGTTFASWWESVSRANTTGLINSTTLLAGAVSGGVAMSDEFDGASANDPGVYWTVVSDGSGAGFYGLNGIGRVVWKTSGALSRRHVNVYDVPLATDTQLVSCVIGAVPALPASVASNPPWTYLIGRSNAAGDTFTWARFNDFKLQLGYTVSGVYTQFSGAEVTRSGWSGGAELEFYLGTDADDRELIVRANGLTVLTHTDSGDLSTMGASNRYVGVVASAVGFSSFTQMTPPSLSAWAASDRLASATS